ncbi:hypothetical protein BGZ94_010409 [Podila epigama]|nr:hypothetical protein BGZ94_010409 [Podila epigama]
MGIIAVIKTGILVYLGLVAFILVIPESLRKTSKKTPTKAPVNDSDTGNSTMKSAIQRVKSSAISLVKPLALFVPGNIPTSDKTPSKYVLFLMLVSSQCANLALSGDAINFYPFTNLVFKWDEYEDGIFLSFQGACAFVTFFFVFPWIHSYYERHAAKSEQSSSTQETIETESASEVNALSKVESIKKDILFVVAGFILAALGYFLIPLFLSPVSFFVGNGIAEFGGIAGPALMSAITAIVPTEMVGEALGAACIADVISSTAGYLGFASIFSHTSKTRPWLYFYVTSAMYLLAGIAAMSIQCLYRRPKPIAP